MNDIIYDIVISTAQGGVALREKGLSEIRDLTLGNLDDSILDLTPLNLFIYLCYIVSLMLDILIKIMRK